MDISNYNNQKQKHATIIVFMIIIIMQAERGSKIKLLKGNPIFKGLVADDLIVVGFPLLSRFSGGKILIIMTSLKNNYCLFKTSLMYINHFSVLNFALNI